jgi:hypothetical protein
MGLIQQLKRLRRSLVSNTWLPIDFGNDVGLKSLEELWAGIEAYAKENGKKLEYQSKGMPIRLTLDGEAYMVRRGSGRGGPVYGVQRDHGDF